MAVPRKTKIKAAVPAIPTEVENLEAKRVRLLASLNLLGGIGLVIALPFALRAGAEFFLPVTAALARARSRDRACRLDSVAPTNSSNVFDVATGTAAAAVDSITLTPDLLSLRAFIVGVECHDRVTDL